jgi:hypothetical protein
MFWTRAYRNCNNRYYKNFGRLLIFKGIRQKMVGAQTENPPQIFKNFEGFWVNVGVKPNQPIRFSFAPSRLEISLERLYWP